MLELQHQHKMNEIQAKGEIDMVLKQMELNRQVVYTAGFDEEKDRDDNNRADYVEYAMKAQKDNEELKLKWAKENREREQFDHKKKYDNEKLKLENKKLNKPTNKK
jgi:hypothetical protein